MRNSVIEDISSNILILEYRELGLIKAITLDNSILLKKTRYRG